MNGRRFGVGLAAGLLVGLAVLTASGGLSFAPVLFAPSGNQSSLVAMVATTTATATTTMGSTALNPGGNSSVPYTVSHGNATKSVSSTTTSVSPSFTPSTTSTYPRFPSAVVAPLPSSRFSSISQQPLLSNAILSVPVVIAFLLGAILYRASLRGREVSGEQPDSSET